MTSRTLVGEVEALCKKTSEILEKKLENYKDYDNAEAQLQTLEPVRNFLDEQLDKVNRSMYELESAMEDYKDWQRAMDE